MKYAIKMLTQLTPRGACAVSLMLILSLCIGCLNLSTVGNVGNTLLDEIGDVNIFTDAEEQQFGKEFVAQHEQQVTFHTDPFITNYINDLGQTLVRYSKRKTSLIRSRWLKQKALTRMLCPVAIFTCISILSEW